MNWQQLYNAVTPTEREELLLDMFRRLEARHQKIIIARGRLRRERRRAARLHFIKDRRLALSRIQRTRSVIFKSIFVFIMATISLATWLIAVNAHPVVGAPMLLGYILVIFALLLIKPNRKRLKVTTAK